MSLFLRPASPTPSNTSLPSLRRASISTAGSARIIPQTPKRPALELHSKTKDMSHTFSRTWLSNQTKEMERWHNRIAALERLGLSREETILYLPWEWKDWLDYRIAEESFKQRQFHRNAKKKQEDKIKNKQAFISLGGKLLAADRGAVLAEQTIWCSWSNSRYGSTIWPSSEELSYEGDKRIATGVRGDRKAFRRCLPIVRDWKIENDTKAWGKIHALKPYNFDLIQRPPAREDIYMQPYAVTDDELPGLLNKDIIAALDEDDFS